MPEDKKNKQKGKNDAKEQRKPRQGRQRSGAANSAGPPPAEKTEESKVTVPQKPMHEQPGPDFYKNLKRETDEILKITEEANSKYKKKEIQSNWSKYEMPIVSYEAIDEQESMGADYEQLIQMPLSAGGHFQFKHEKSWDAITGPSPYDKYFEINMNNLANALCTIPFYERNNIEKGIFRETDILTMDNRSVKYKQKYFNDKSYTTPELEAKDKILNNFKEAFSATEKADTNNGNVHFIEEPDNKAEETPGALSVKNNEQIKLSIGNEKIENMSSNEIINVVNISQTQEVREVIDEIDDLLLDDEVGGPSILTEEKTASSNNILNTEESVGSTEKVKEINATSKSDESKKPAIESPEDLEKWLDDFLDG